MALLHQDGIYFLRLIIAWSRRHHPKCKKSNVASKLLGMSSFDKSVSGDNAGYASETVFGAKIRKTALHCGYWCQKLKVATKILILIASYLEASGKRQLISMAA